MQTLLASERHYLPASEIRSDCEYADRTAGFWLARWFEHLSPEEKAARWQRMRELAILEDKHEDLTRLNVEDLWYPKEMCFSCLVGVHDVCNPRGCRCLCVRLEAA